MGWLPVFLNLKYYFDEAYREGKFYNHEYYHRIIERLKISNDEFNKPPMLSKPHAKKSALDILYRISLELRNDCGVALEREVALDLYDGINTLLESYDYFGNEELKTIKNRGLSYYEKDRMLDMANSLQMSLKSKIDKINKTKEDIKDIVDTIDKIIKLDKETGFTGHTEDNLREKRYWLEKYNDIT